MIVKVVSKTGCPWCLKAKEWLNSNRVKFIEEVIDDVEKRAEFYRSCGPGVNSVPQIFLDDDRIGGYTELIERGSEVLNRIFGEKRDLRRFSKSYKPFMYQFAVDLWKTHEKIHWIEDEAELGDDVTDWQNGKMSSSDKAFVTHVLNLFTTSDVAVGANYYDYLIPVIKNNEVRNMLGSFAAREAIHQSAYAFLNETLGFSDESFSAFLEYKELADKVDFMLDNDNSSHKAIAHTMAKSVFNEGVMLFASFAMLLNFQRFGKMKGMCKIVEWSQRDEDMHVEGISKLFRTYCEEHPRIVNDEFKKVIYDMARNVVELEDKFIDLAFSTFIIEGLTKEEVKLYIRYMTDKRLLQLGLKANYGVVENPLPWITWIMGGKSHTNFFEGRVTDYSVGSLTGNWNESYNFLEVNTKNV
jgi:glutaredoxin 3